TDENALVCDFDVPQGSRLRFSMPPDFDIVEKVLEGANELKNTSHAEAEALLIFSCAGRYSALGPLTNVENDGLSDVWKAPMAGFFTYGEYGRAINGKHEFHSTTCCWVVLKEK
ncbi:MAG: FIST C-terminal domain-containing protein, partial [Chitinophagaceae bacterium]|nr:FIST C-terminal domain-containing protein [Chitinophagaceae bacterium]